MLNKFCMLYLCLFRYLIIKIWQCTSIYIQPNNSYCEYIRRKIDVSFIKIIFHIITKVRKTEHLSVRKSLIYTVNHTTRYRVYRYSSRQIPAKSAKITSRGQNFYSNANEHWTDNKLLKEKIGSPREWKHFTEVYVMWVRGKRRP